jgi:hypothetical protein
MTATRRQLDSLLRSLVDECTRAGDELRVREDQHYPLAMALRGYALEYAYYLARHRGPVNPALCAQHLAPLAGLCTGALTPLRRTWLRVAAEAGEVPPEEEDGDAPPPVSEDLRAALVGASRPAEETEPAQ